MKKLLIVLCLVLVGCISTARAQNYTVWPYDTASAQSIKEYANRVCRESSRHLYAIGPLVSTKHLAKPDGAGHVAVLFRCSIHQPDGDPLFYKQFDWMLDHYRRIAAQRLNNPLGAITSPEEGWVCWRGPGVNFGGCWRRASDCTKQLEDFKTLKISGETRLYRSCTPQTSVLAITFHDSMNGAEITLQYPNIESCSFYRKELLKEYTGHVSVCTRVH